MNQYLNFSLEGKVALVTGASYGIGFAIASAFAEQGATICFNDINQELVDKGLASYAEKGIKAHGYVCDVTDEPAVQAMVATIAKEVGTIDILVNNAGVINKTFFGNTLESDFDMVIDTDLKGPYFLSELFAEYMKENKIQGNILNVSSSSSIRPANNSYGLAKWGIRGMTLGLAKHLSADGIVVNAIAPGPTATSMLMGNDEQSISRPASPSGRYTTPEEVSNLSVVLVSDLGRMINGDTVYVTGGCGLLTFDDWS